MAVDKFVLKHLELLEWEREAELEETKNLIESLSPLELQKRGVCIRKLEISSRSSGLYGRALISFELSLRKDLPSHSFSAGDIVGVSSSQGQDPPDDLGSGIVSKVTRTHIVVAFENDSLDLVDEKQYRLTKLANDVTYRRLKKALNELRKYKNAGPAAELILVLFQETELGIPVALEEEKFKFFNPNLDSSQQDAVKFSLAQREVAVVHGPPGTGKTTTVVEIILQSVKLGQKILACAPSNIAVDNLLEQLARNHCKVVRLGHPARSLASAQEHALDAILSNSDDTKLVRDVRADIDAKMAEVKNTRHRGEKEGLRSHIRNLRRELRERETFAMKNVLSTADVVLSTLSSSANDGPLQHLPDDHFDLVVIDECAQALEAACWIPLQRASKCVLAGDHLQLPPVIHTDRPGLEVTLMERIVKALGDKVTRLLTVQYRMNEAIMLWPSRQLYEDKLVAHSSVKQHTLRDLSGVEDNEFTSTPLLVIDTVGCGLYELELENEFSKGNEGEADLVAMYVKKLVDSGVDPAEIAVISPYNLQVDLLRLRLSSSYPTMEIKSVDGFQGREKEAVIMSLVRSNASGEVGFLAEDRRINVAITRARRHLAIICDSETVNRHAFLKSLLEYMNEHGEVYSSEQFEDETAKIDQSVPSHSELHPEVSGKSAGAKSKQEAPPKKPQTKQQGGKPTVSHQAKPKDTRPSGQENNEKKEEKIPELTSMLEEFVTSDKESMTFPSTLTSYERMKVHELSEKLRLVHISQGEGSERCVTVKKQATNGATPKSTANDKPKPAKKKVAKREPDTDLGPAETASPEAIEVENCPICGKRIPESSTLQLHTLHCEKVQRTQRKKKPPVETSDKPKVDLDSVLEKVVKEDNTCHYSRCKMAIKILSQTCQFCTKRFCLAHFTPEVHGCGDAARVHAKQMIQKEGKIYPGSGIPSKKPDPSKRAHLEKKLQKKLTDLSDRRAGKGGPHKK